MGVEIANAEIGQLLAGLVFFRLGCWSVFNSVFELDR
jgi:hypothetical protein